MQLPHGRAGAVPKVSWTLAGATLAGHCRAAPWRESLALAAMDTPPTIDALPRARPRKLRWVLELVLAIGLVVAIRAYQRRDLPTGVTLSLAGTTLDGAAVSLADYRGKPMILHFWATWCGVCRAEQGNIDAIAKDLPVLTIASQSGAEHEVASYVRDHAIAPRVLVDETNTLTKRFGVSAFPTTFVLDGKGEIRHVEVGYTTELGLRARMWLAGQ